jgi:lipopolysaccharide transport system ATP-binding protein
MTRSDTPRPARRTVAHVGAFDLASYGDQLFPLVAAAELGRRIDDVELLPFSPMGVVDTGDEPNAAAWALGPWSETRAAQLAARSSLVLCGGGEIVYGDGTLYTPFYGIDRRDAAALGIDKWFIEALGPAEGGCPVVWHAPGVPAELDSATALRVRRAAERRALVAVRDEASRQRLEAAGVETAVDVVPDSALLIDRVLTPDALAAARDRLRYAKLLPPEGPVVVVQGNNTMTPLAEDLARALDEHAPGLQIVTISVSPCHGDQLFAATLRNRSTRRTWDLPTTASLEEVAATIAGADCYLGVSLHGAITAVAYERPSVTYDPFGQAKLAGFVELAGIPESRTGDLVEAARLVARYGGASAEGAAAPATRRAELQRTLDDHFDRVAELVERSDTPRDPVTWADTAAGLQLGLRRLPRPVAPAPATKLPALRRPALAPTVDDLAAAVARALAVRRRHTVDEPDEHEGFLRLQQENNDVRGAIAHLEGVVAKAELTETELRDELTGCTETREALEEVLATARGSRIFRLTGRPRALSEPEA